MVIGEPGVSGHDSGWFGWKTAGLRVSVMITHTQHDHGSGPGQYQLGVAAFFQGSLQIPHFTVVVEFQPLLESTGTIRWGGGGHRAEIEFKVRGALLDLCLHGNSVGPA